MVLKNLKNFLTRKFKNDKAEVKENFMDQKGKTALVTGATSGIGLEIARLHASRGGDLVLVARRKERLESIKSEFESQFGINVQIIIKDLSNPRAFEDVYQETLVPINYLVNCAGFGMAGYFHESRWKGNEEMINLNVTSLAGLTHCFLQDMIKRKSGKILNVSSIAGFLPGPLQQTYYATKAFVLSFSLAIANEVADKNITVSILCPGPVKTEFHTVAGYVKGEDKSALPDSFANAEEVALIGYEGMLKGKGIIVPGIQNKFIIMLTRLLPRHILARMVRNSMEKIVSR